jgi:hypothetical protein
MRSLIGCLPQLLLQSFIWISRQALTKKTTSATINPFAVHAHPSNQHQFASSFPHLMSSSSRNGSSAVTPTMSLLEEIKASTSGAAAASMMISSKNNFFNKINNDDHLFGKSDKLF